MTCKAWLLGALLVGCAHGPTPAARVHGGGGDGGYARSLEALRAGRFADALAGFQTYAAGGGEPALVSAAHEYVVLSLVALGACDRARGALQEVPPALQPGARVAVDRCRALVTAADLDAALATPADSAGDLPVPVLLLASRLTLDQGAPPLGGGTPPSLDAAGRARVESWIDDLAPDGVERAFAVLPDHARWPAPRLAFRRVALAVHAQDLAGARALLGDLVDPALLAEATHRIDSAAALARVDAHTIGVLLPLSGKFAPIGKELRAAVELAADGEAGVHLVFADSAGDETRAVAALDDLVARSHPLLVLGPVGVREAAAVSARAAVLGVPLGMLSPAEGLADPRAGIVRLVSSAEGRARGAAHAAIAMGFEAFAILAPADELGRAQARAFAETARRSGAQVVVSAEYDPTATDLDPDVKNFLGLDPATNERLRAHLRRHPKDGWKTFSPDIDFDLLYIPDSYERAALVASFLTFYNVELRATPRGDAVDSARLARKHGGHVPSIVQLMGSSGWHDRAILVRGGPSVDGALVVDDFAGDPGEDVTQIAQDSSFAARWLARTGRPPSAIAAQAFDAARMALGARTKALEAGGEDVRAAARRALAQAGLDTDAPGRACAPAHVDAGGELDREPIVLRIDGGEFTLDRESP